MRNSGSARKQNHLASNDDDDDDDDDGDGFGKNGAEPLLDSFDSYIVVSVLTATASFAALFEANPGEHEHPRMPILHNLTVLVCAICTLSGIYATVVFSFSSIYGRAAVGTGRMDVCETFLENTGPIRAKAFWMYLLSLVLFVVLLVFTATEKIDPDLRKPFLVLLMGLSALAYKDWNAIIVAAAPIFAANEEKSAQRQSAIEQHQHKH